MRLINVATLDIEKFDKDEEIPPYSILSHRCIADEVTLQDMQQGKATERSGFAKIQNLCQVTKSWSLAYCWADTCCIDKTNGAEVSEAINSMYKWYAESAICVAFLCDAEVGSRITFIQSSWFSRGWTLQELIAPHEMSFYDRNWRLIGSRSDPDVLLDTTSATGIPLCLLAQDNSPRDYSVAQRLSWAVNRTTTREEDMAYCLMGLLDINMPLLYGEGKEDAFLRLQGQCIKQSDDMSIFAWTSPPCFAYTSDSSSWGSVGRSLLAPSIQCFTNCGTTRMNQKRHRESEHTEEFRVTNSGLSISLPISDRTPSTYIAMLNCSNWHSHNGTDTRCDIGILLHHLPQKNDQFTRISIDKEDIVYSCQYDVPFAIQATMIPRRIFVPLKSTLRFRDWSINISELMDSRLDWNHAHEKSTIISTEPLVYNPRDYPKPTPGRERYSHEETGRTISVRGSTISAIRFGIDSKFNPVMFVFAPVMFVFAAALDPDDHMMRKDFWWNDHMISKFSTDLELKWKQDGFFALRGHYENGLEAKIHFLNLYVKIGGTQLWSVRFMPLVNTPNRRLPHL